MELLLNTASLYWTVPYLPAGHFQTTCVLIMHVDLFFRRLSDIGYIMSIHSNVLAGRLDDVASKQG